MEETHQHHNINENNNTLCISHRRLLEHAETVPAADASQDTTAGCDVRYNHIQTSDVIYGSMHSSDIRYDTTGNGDYGVTKEYQPPSATDVRYVPTPIGDTQLRYNTRICTSRHTDTSPQPTSPSHTSPAVTSAAHSSTDTPSANTHSAATEQADDSDDVTNYGNVMLWLNRQVCGGNVRRQRRISKTQRLAANMRERNRMVLINGAFESLRRTVPSATCDKRLSRIQTLRLAMHYIAFMTELVYGRESSLTRATYALYNSGESGMEADQSGTSSY